MPFDRWNRVLALIEERLRDEGEIDVAALAGVTHTSEYHFRRVFPVLVSGCLALTACTSILPPLPAIRHLAPASHPCDA